MHLTSAWSDSLDIVDYFGLSSLDRDIGGGYGDISAYDIDYFDPSTNKHNHIHPKDRELVGQEGTVVPSTTTIGIFLITVAHAHVTSFHRSLAFLKGICCTHSYSGC